MRPCGFQVAASVHTVPALASTEMCPFGDDPGTTDNADFTLQLTIDTTDAASALGGTVQFWFSGQTAGTTMEANGDDATEAECKAAWESLDNVATATCFKGTVEATTKSTTWTVRLVFAGGYMNNLHNHNGNPSLSQFTCNVYVPVLCVRCNMWVPQALTHASRTAGAPRAGLETCLVRSLRSTAR